jgi:hypothetical protein
MITVRSMSLSQAAHRGMSARCLNGEATGVLPHCSGSSVGSRKSVNPCGAFAFPGMGQTNQDTRIYPQVTARARAVSSPEGASSRDRHGCLQRSRFPFGRCTRDEQLYFPWLVVLGFEGEPRPCASHVDENGLHSRIRRTLDHLPTVGGALSAFARSNHRTPPCSFL